MLNKPLRSQFRAIQIPPCQTSSTDVHLPRDPDRYRLPLRIQNVDLQVWNRHADHAACVQIVLRQRAICDVHGRFRDAIHVYQPRLLVAVSFEPRTQAVHLKCFAAEDHVAQSERALAHHLFSLDKLSKG